MAIFQNVLLGLQSYIKHLSRTWGPCYGLSLAWGSSQHSESKETPLHSLLKFYEVFLLG